MDKLNEIRQLKQEVANPHESERIRATARVLVEMEQRPRQSYMEVVDSAGIEPETTPVDVEERVDELCDVIAAKAPGGPSMVEAWLRNRLPEEFDEDTPESLKAYAQMDHSEWEGQIGRWADLIRNEHDGLEGYEDRELANEHIENYWGVSIDRFEEVVVGLDTERAMNDLLTQPTDETADAIKSLSEVVA
ncbi:hypothetical protein [Halomicrobium mukohataei]|nr:hypothetical protein [Halomicrobium mukohataei]